MNLPILRTDTNGFSFNVSRVVKSRWCNDSESHAGLIIACDGVSYSWSRDSKQVVNEREMQLILIPIRSAFPLFNIWSPLI